jgi:hypothetical protein
MGKYPVIFLTLKGVEGLTFTDAKMMLKSILSTEMDRHYYPKTKSLSSAPLSQTLPSRYGLFREGDFLTVPNFMRRQVVRKLRNGRSSTRIQSVIAPT